MVVAQARGKPRAASYVSIVSANPETLDGLHAYFEGAGVSSHCTSAVRNLDRVASRCATAAVLFPDDFDDGDVLALVKQLRRARPRLFLLIVTRQPQRFRDVAKPDGRSLPPIILPKPSFGWDILDAIRAQSAAEDA
jgi:hypothetical protein